MEGFVREHARVNINIDARVSWRRRKMATVGVLLQDLKRQDDLLTKLKLETEKVLGDIEENDDLAGESRDLESAIAKYNKDIRDNAVKQEALKTVSGQDGLVNVWSEYSKKLKDMRKEERKRKEREKREADSQDRQEQGTDDLILSQVKQSLICPFSKKQMVDPVLNTCGHSYSRAIVEQLFSQKGDGRVKCAVCIEYIHRKNLRHNEKLAREIRRAKAKA